MKILLAEDSLTMRRLLASQLERWNYEVTEVEDGQEAWEEFQRGQYSMVLTDWVMPKSDGIELTRRIRALKHHEYVYVVLLTARSEKEDLVEAMEAGADDFLGKPCNPSELRVRLLACERIMELEHTLIDQNQRLMEAQAALVQSEKLAGVGQLAAGMAHEINNPIAFVTNNLAVLQRDVQALIELTEQYQQALPAIDQVDKQAAARVQAIEAEMDFAWMQENMPRLFESSRDGLSRVRHIIGNLRDFAHLDEAAIDEMDLVEAIQSTLQVLTPNFQTQNIDTETDFQCRPKVPCQPAKIKQVLHSILLNAIQASGSGGSVRVTVTEDDQFARVAIEDDGSGMDATTKQRLFEPFYTTRPVGAGSGLGLAVAYGVIRQHQGEIEFDSTPEKGTTFRVMLPKERR